MFEGDSADTWFVRAKCKHIPDELWRWQANIVTTILKKIEKWKKRKVLRIAWFRKKIDQKNILKFCTPPQILLCLELPDSARKLIRILFWKFYLPPSGFFRLFLRLLCRHVRRKISADVDGGLSGVSRCADTGARTPIGVSGNFLLFLLARILEKPLGPETDEMCQFLGPEIVKMGQHSFWAQKLTLRVSFWAQKLTLWARDTLWAELYWCQMVREMWQREPLLQEALLSQTKAIFHPPAQRPGVQRHGSRQ